MHDDTPLLFDLPAVARKKVTAAFDGGRLSSDADVPKGRSAQARRPFRALAPHPRTQACGQSNAFTALTNAASAGLWRRPDTETSETVRLIPGST